MSVMGNCCQKSKATKVRLVSVRSYTHNVDVSFENGRVDIKTKRHNVPENAVSSLAKTSDETKRTDSTQVAADDDTVLKEQILDCLRKTRKWRQKHHQQAWGPPKKKAAPPSTVEEAPTSMVKASSNLDVFQLLDLSEQLGMLVTEQGRIHDLISVLGDSQWSPLAFFLFRYKEAHALFVARLEMEAQVTVNDKKGNKELVTRVFSQWQRLLPQIDAMVQEGRPPDESLSLETLE